MEIIWLILAILLFLGLSIAYWQKLKKEYIEYHSADSQTSQQQVRSQKPRLQEQEIVLQPLPDLALISSVRENEDFHWSENGQKILGITAMGRATIERLDMNDDRHDDGSIQLARRFWICGGWHPPTHDPQQ